MDQSLTPREIQARIRAGASVADLVDESGMSAERVEAFAGPVLAEREHIAQSARAATIRRRGEGGTHRRLGELITARLRSRNIDADALQWDAWRQSDLKWRVVAKLPSGAGADPRTAEFVFDPKGRFSSASNPDARWMIGEEQVGAAPEDENTVDLNDELALVRATQRESPIGDEVPVSQLMHEANEDTSELDSLYDMLSGISEDSVRIYTGLMGYEDDEPDEPADEAAEADPEPATAPPAAPVEEEATEVIEAGPATEEVAEPQQDALVDGESPPPAKQRRRRAKVPSWDEIMFGGPGTT